MNKKNKNNIEQNSNIKKPILAIVLGIMSLVLADVISSLVYKLQLPDSIRSIIFSVIYIAISYSCIRLCCTKILNISMNRCFIGKPTIKIIWLIVAILLPVIVSIILLSISGELVENNMSSSQATNIIVHAIFRSGLSAGIVEEMVFRGMIMKTLEDHFGKIIAIVFPSLIFALLHAINIKMDIISVILLIVAGTSVGIMFSLIVYESGSIWSSAIVHGIWNVIMIGGILNIGDSYQNNAIYSYKLLSKSVILTGGSFGIESSIISILGFCVVITLALFLVKKNQKTIPNEKALMQ